MKTATTRPRSTTEKTPDMVRLIDSLAVREGTHETSLPGVWVSRRTNSEPRHPAIYQALLIFLAQGAKEVYLEDEVLRYDADHYLALALPVPVECEILKASPKEPLLAVSLVVDPAMLAEILISLDEPTTFDGALPRGIYASRTSPELRSTVVRLLECLHSPVDSRILGKQIVREIVYRVLRDEPGDALRALATRNDQFMRIARVVQQIQAEYGTSLSVEDMAKRANMGVSTFHHNFKAVTGKSPLQYLKSIRLHRARLMMVHAGHNAGTAAAAVGYESPSQFGREFKRMFGESPAEETAAIRARLAAGIVEARDRWVPDAVSR
ncbi:RCS-specific HTH-type transcriptional activator RclR [Phycisphaerales bacterium]|nr:RCS-specific HTH-type transcriptional activator RclR [Phycisphaerales bacterium]